MSKRLPYYQSEPAEYLAGDIMFCSYAAQGVFRVVRALYWQKDCTLTLTQLKRRLTQAEEHIEELIEEGIIKVDNDDISITFLDEQFNKAVGKSKANSENGKKGAAKRWANKGIDSESIATPLKKDSESIALREDKIKEDKIKEEESEGKFTPEQFLTWFNKSRTKNLEKPSNINFLSQFSKVHLEILTSRYSGNDFSKAFHNICNDKWANESNNIMPKHFLNPEQFTK
ncbi:MAG: hypothetical protein HRT87_09525, partial [Legionellales bacterium]|nr:hypothetical protein [Legionellales bacterium]